MRRVNNSHFKKGSLVVLTNKFICYTPGNTTKLTCYTPGHIFSVWDPQKYGKDYRIRLCEPKDTQGKNIVEIPKKYLADVKKRIRSRY